MLKVLKFSSLLLLVATPSQAVEEVSINLYMTAAKGVGKPVGSISILETEYGLLFKPNLKGLAPGVHGFHIHVNPSCDKNGDAAGGHLDPEKKDKHLGPYEKKGHLGDLPAIYVEKDGSAKIPVLAPRFKKLSEISNHSLMLHEGGDNYSDNPTLGGGGHRMACGVIKGKPAL